MNLKDNRSIPAKTNLTVDQYVDLVADAKAANKSASSLLRDCWLACRNANASCRKVTRPSLAPFQAKFAPARAVRPAAYMRS
jgi:hypothetical protein